MKRTALVALLCLVVFACLSASVRADTLYWTNQSGGAIKTITTQTSTITTVFSGASSPNSLIFNATGTQIIYSNLAGGVSVVNWNGTGNHQIATGAQLGGSSTQDIVLEPGRKSILVSETDTGKIYRINLTTNSVSLFATTGGHPRGMTYDNSGHLLVNVDGVGLDQLDPTTGAVLTSATFSGWLGDGLTFDGVSLWAVYGSDVVRITNFLSSSAIFVTTMIHDSATGSAEFDAVQNTGLGSLYVTDVLNGLILQISTVGGTPTLLSLSTTPGIEDLAPVTGLGAPPAAVPEPSSMLLLGTVASLISWRFRKKFAR